MIAILVGGDDFRSSLFLLIGASREALIKLFTGREGDIPISVTVEVSEVIFFHLVFYLFFFFVHLMDCSGISNKVYLVKIAGIQLRVNFLHLYCQFMIHPVGKSLPLAVC